MGTDLPESGIRAVLEGMPEFERDAKKLDATMERIDSAMAATAKASKISAAEIEQMAKEFLDAGGDVNHLVSVLEDGAAEIERFGKSADTATQSTNKMVDGLSALTKLQSFQALERLSGYAGQAANKLTGLTMESVQSAARLEELGLVLENLAVQNNVSAEALNQQVDAVRNQGIQADVAYNLVSQFTRGQLDLSKASDLARVAQDAAVISMEDSSQALAGLLHGIMTLQPEVLRYRGIIIDLQTEYKNWAEANNRQVSSMTAVEKQQIALDAVIAQGATIAGTYDSAMESASKQLRSMPRYIADLKAEMGESLLPVYSDVIFAAKDTMSWMDKQSDATKAAAGAVIGLSGGLLKGASSMVGFVSQVGEISAALNALGLSANATKLAVVGLGVAFAGVAAIGVYTYVAAREKELEAEAAQIAVNAESYGDYVIKIQEAELANYALSQELWEVVQAHKEAEGAARAQAEAEALIITPTEELKEQFGELADRLIGTVQQLEILTDGYNAAKTALFTGKDAQEAFNEAVLKSGGYLIDEEVALQNATSALQEQTSLWPTSVESVSAYNAEIIKSALALEDMMQAALEAQTSVGALTNKLDDLGALADPTKALAYSMDLVAQAAAKAADEIAKAEAEAATARSSTLSKFNADAGKAWDDYKKKAQSVQADITASHLNYLKDITKAEQNAARDRMKIAADLASALADLDTQLAQDRVAAASDLASDLANIDAQYAARRQQAAEQLAESLAALEESLVEARQDAAERLTDALEDLEEQLVDARENASKRLQKNLEQLEEDRQKAVEDSEERHQDRLLALAEARAEAATAIEKSYQEQRQAILDAYAGKEKRDLVKERQELLSELKRLQKGLASGGEGLTDKEYVNASELIRKLKEQLEKLKEEELESLEDRKDQALEELDERAEEERKKLEEAHEEELSDIDKRAEEVRQKYQEDYDEQLKDLEEAAKKRREKLEEAYREQLEDLEAAARDQREKLQQKYLEQLADLEAAKQAEITARQTAYTQELADIDAKHEQEKIKAEQRAIDSLAEIDARLLEEKGRLDAAHKEDLQRLSDKLTAEQTNYTDRLDAMKTAYADQIETIDEKEAEKKEKAQTAAEETVENVILAWENLDPEMARLLEGVLWDAILPEMQTWQDEMVRKAREIVEAVKHEMEAAFQMGSPSKWAQDFVGNLAAGTMRGMPKMELAMGEIAATMSPQQVDAPALPSLPPSGGSTVTNSRSYTLDYKGVPQSESSVKSLFTMMEIASGG